VLGKTATVGQAIPADSNGVTSTISVTAGEASFIERVEHVVVYVNTQHTNRGDLEIILTSPSGTNSRLAWRSSDETDHYNLFKFMTVRNWDETAAGSWSLQVVDQRSNSITGTFTSWRLAIYGKCTGRSAAECQLYQMDPVELCTNTCGYASDGDCDDGGTGSAYSVCNLGTDCADCGTRTTLDNDVVTSLWNNTTPEWLPGGGSALPGGGSALTTTQIPGIDGQSGPGGGNGGSEADSAPQLEASAGHMIATLLVPVLAVLIVER
jgi:subtilisin-like proprotein convertase family protein